MMVINSSLCAYSLDFAKFSKLAYSEIKDFPKDFKLGNEHHFNGILKIMMKIRFLKIWLIQIIFPRN